VAVSKPHRTWWLPLTLLLPLAVSKNIHLKIGVNGSLESGKVGGWVGWVGVGCWGCVCVWGVSGASVVVVRTELPPRVRLQMHVSKAHGHSSVPFSLRP
jgi:hypothetical protein